jgi:hypothetical protein
VNTELPPGMVRCPIWGTPAYPLAGYSDRDGVGVSSPRAGGKYFISRSAQVNLGSFQSDLKVKLTHEIVDHNLLGSIPEILTTTLDGLAGVARSRPADRATRLLQYLVRESRFLGQEISGHREPSMWEVDAGVSFGFATSPEAHSLFAWSDSTEEEEVVFLLHMLAEEQAVRIDGQAGIPNVVVLPKGYDRVTQETAATQLNQAFVAMWFDEIMMAPYEFGMEPAIREAGYQPLRID